MYKEILKTPIHWLYYITDVNELRILNDGFPNFLREKYNIEQRKEIIQSLKWAIDNPDFDFTSLARIDTLSSSELYIALTKIYEFMIKHKLNIE